MNNHQPHYYFIHRIYKPPQSGFTRRIILSRLLFFFGIIVLLWVGYPLIQFQLFESPKLSNNKFLNPSSPPPRLSNTSVVANDNTVDYSLASNWFPDYHYTSEGNIVNQYSLSIPKLKINQASVALTGEDLSKSLVHYGGTALPGKPGNGVIFGHSILPQFYNPNNYMAIFSTLHTMDKGDQIILEYDNITYQYQVIEMFEVQPKDISVLDQEYDDQYLTLITCTPPGTYLRRLIVKAKLVPYQQSI